MKKLVLLILACFCFFSLHAAYLKDVPTTLTQPDGSVLHCYASGDEYFNYLHDENGFTIMQHPQTGFYVYADKRDGQLVATEFVAGRVDPASTNLQPFNLISPQEWMARRNAWHENDSLIVNRDRLANHGTLNNIVIFIRFSDDTQFTKTYSSIDNMFNDESPNAVSMRTYFRAASYGAIEIPTTFYPGHIGESIVSYQDTYPRSYFQPYNASTNPNGYQESEEEDREEKLLQRAVNYVNDNYPVPTSLNIDYDNDDKVDNVCFIVKGSVGNWNNILWPHKGKLDLDNNTVRINGKRVYTYNFHLADSPWYFTTSTLCHEMNHSLGAPDLYHYDSIYRNSRIPVGIWDLMHNHTTPPQHCGAYMKMKYGHWIDEIPEITQPGTYTLNPISSPTPTNIAYKILSDDPNQFYVLEYRDNTSLFETGLPGSGLLIYRIDTRFNGNYGYDPSDDKFDEVYIFRPGGSYTENGSLNSAHFSSDVGRTEFNFSTSAFPFFTDGTRDYSFGIFNITNSGSTISFSYVNSSNCEPPTNLVASVENIAVSLSWEAANNAAWYNVYRNGTFIGYTTGTSFIDDNTDFNTSYTYTVNSVNLIGLLSTSSEPTSVITPEGVFIGGENSQLICNGTTYLHNYLPSHSTSKYSFSEQIYTAEELGDAGFISSIAFYNEGAEAERKYDIYLKCTTKSCFSNTTDWEIVSDYDKVFSGYVYMQANDWTVITFNTPFAPFDYDGHTNVILAVDDNTGDQTPMIRCRTFRTDERQAILNYGSIDIDPSDPNYDPNGPAYMSRSHTTNLKNQLLITKTAKSDYLPSYSYYKYALSQQLYTTDELGDAGYITSIAFYNDGAKKTRTYDIYMKPTQKDKFDSNADWENVSDSNLVFSGSVTMQAHHWNPIIFDTPFAYNGNTNVVLVVDDNTGSYTYAPHMSCRVFNTDETQAIYNYSDIINYDPSSPASTGTMLSKKNLLYVAKDPAPTFNVSVSANPTEGGTVTGAGTYIQGQSCTVTATANEGYEFVNWKKNGEVVSSNASYSFTVTGNSILVAQFVLDGIIVFADADVKELCVTNWDTNGDGELSYAEAATVTSLENVFRNDSSITSFDELQYFIGLTFTGNWAFYCCSSLTSIKIPNSVTSIGIRAFGDCSGLTSIEIPNSVTAIGSYAFYNCTGLTSMTVLADNPPILASNVFHGVNNSIPVYVPCGSLEAYQLAVGWNQFTNIQELCTQTQTIELVAGWNWFSTNLEITLDELKEALTEVAPGTNILIKSKTQNTVYNPVTNQWRGTLNTLDLTQMYMISVCTNCEIILTGTPINPTEHPITIQNGFNWIEFPLSENMSISNAFEGIVVNGDVIQSKTNNASYINGHWRGNFNTLEPGKGYMYKSNSSEPKTLVY